MQYGNPGRFLATYWISVRALCHTLTKINRFQIADIAAQSRINERNEPQQLLSISFFQKRIEHFPRQTHKLRKPT
jgi:hypothetical protein